MKLKKLIALLLVVIMTMSLFAGCGSAEDEELEFYFVSLMSGGAAWSRAEQGFYDACEELGISGQYLAPVERGNMVEIANLIDQCVTQEADALIGVLASIEMFGPSLLKGMEQGTVIGSVQMIMPEEYAHFNIGTNQEEQGIKFAEALAELAGDKEYNVIWLNTGASESNNMQYAAFEEALKAYPNIKCLGMRFDEGSAATANQILTDELTANPDLNAVVCLNSSCATIGTASFIDEKGLEDEWLTIGIDASADILNYVKSGALDATMNQDFYAMGYESVKMAYEKIVNDVEPVHYYDTGMYLIHADEVDEYAANAGIDLG